MSTSYTPSPTTETVGLIGNGNSSITMPIATAALRLGVGEDWLARQARAGLVPHVKLGRRRRFTEDHLVQILRAREQVAAEDPWVRDAKQVARRRRRAS